MTELLPEFALLPVRGAFDGELVAFGDDGKPSFDRLCRRMLQRDGSVPVALVLFDVLELDGESTLRLPYLERRELLESLTFSAACKCRPASTTAPRYGRPFWSTASRASWRSG